MNAKTLRTRLKPHLWYQAYWVVYLIWFFWLDLTVTDPKYIIHSPVDDLIPFNEWFIFPYCSWFVLLAIDSQRPSESVKYPTWGVRRQR